MSPSPTPPSTDSARPVPSTAHLDRAAEAERILERYGDDLPTIMAMLERQFAVLHNRAQVLLAIAGVILSTVGFSGRLIAGTNLTAQVCIVTGVAFVLLSAAVVVGGVLHLRWLTMQGGDDTAQWLMTTLAYRDRKTNFYRVGILLLLIGLTSYAIAVAIMLLKPEEDALPARSRVAEQVTMVERP